MGVRKLVLVEVLCRNQGLVVVRIVGMIVVRDGSNLFILFIVDVNYLNFTEYFRPSYIYVLFRIVSR